MGCHDDDIGDIGAIVMSKVLKKNNTLLQLDVTSNNITEQGAHYLAGALKKNVTCGELLIGGNRVGEELEPIHHYAKLNKAGRKLLTDRKAPIGVWAWALAKAAKDEDILFHFLQNKPDLIQR